MNRKMNRITKNVALLGALSLVIGAGAAHATPRHCAWGHKCPSRPAMVEGRSSAIVDPSFSATFDRHGEDRGYSSYFSPEQNDAYKGRFP
jgi:hypothetical protein